MVTRLEYEPSSQSTFERLQQEPKLYVHSDTAYADIVDLLGSIAQSVQDLHYVDAIDYLRELEDTVETFAEEVQELLDVVHPLRCRNRLRESKGVRWMRWSILMVLLGAALLVGAWASRRRLKPQSKII